MDVRISQTGTVVSLTATHEDGRLIGSVVVEEGEVQVASIQPAFQWQGFYPRFLQLLNAYCGGGLSSSPSPSANAVRAWQKAGGYQSSRNSPWYL